MASFPACLALQAVLWLIAPPPKPPNRKPLALYQFPFFLSMLPYPSFRLRRKKEGKGTKPCSIPPLSVQGPAVLLWSWMTLASASAMPIPARREGWGEASMMGCRVWGEELWDF